MAVAPPNPAEMLLAGSSTAAAKPPDENKELHTTPSRNDRFKVVKIASLEPFKRGRWKCMDYVDEAPPAGTARVPQSSGSIQIPGGAFMQQTQSLPQQQIQQMLLQGGFVANGAQFFQPQLLPQGQYYYPQQGAANQTMPQQQVGSSMPAAQFIANQPYFPNAAGFTVPQSFPNMQYVPANLLQQNQNSAFVPTSQMTATSFQQSQTYAGQTQPLVNGHNFTPQNEQQSSLPTQSVKNVILNTQAGQLQPQQQQQQQQQQQPNITTAQIPVQQQNNQSVQPGVQQFSQQNPAYPPSNSSAQPAQNVVPPQQPPPQQQQHQPVIQTPPVQSQQNFDASNMYTNPQFAVSVNSLTVLDNGGDNATNDNTESNSADAASENVDDPAKTNPVVNAIDNKIEQAMDLVKSHLMYTVREEVEVLKEKIAELMERIQQLETENNFLRSQIPKTSQGVAVAPPATASQTPSPNFIPSSNTQANASHNPIPNAPQAHAVPAGDALNSTQM